MWFILKFILYSIQFQVLGAACTLPDNLRGSTWLDSDQGSLVFTDTHMVGWTFRNSFASGTTISPTWECYSNVSGEYATIIFMSDTTIRWDTAGLDVRPFLCLQMTAITNYSYYYYLNAPEQGNLYNDRINLLFDTAVGSITDPQSEVCNFAPADYTENEYHVLIKDEHAADAIQTCPSAFFGTYSYTVTDLDAGTSTCGTGNERWDVCADRSRMTLNITTCNTSVAYSANGSLFCVASITSGSYILHTVYNEDATVDDVNTFRFTCFVSSLGADGSVTTSQSPKSCTRSQTPHTQPTLTNGTVVGLNLALTPIVLCPLTSPEEEEDSNNTDAVLGGVIGGVALIILLAILVYVCLHFKLLSRLCKRKQHEDAEKDADEKKPIEAEKPVDEENERPQWSDPEGTPTSTSKAWLCWGRQRNPDRKDTFTSEDVREVPNESLPKEDNQTGPISKISNERNITTSFDDKVNERIDDMEKSNTDGSFTDIATVEDELANTRESAKKHNLKVENGGTNTAVQPIRIHHSIGRVESASGEIVDGDDDKDDIHVTRIAQKTEHVLSKGQHLNSTENICADYDAAMSYHSDKMTKRENQDPASLFKRPISSRTFDFVRDDSGIETETVSKQLSNKEMHASNLSKRSSSEGNMLESVKKNSTKSFKKSKSFRSVFNLSSIKWNFNYESPYALSQEQKQASAKKRLQNQKLRQKEERRKRVQEEKRQQENEEAFQRWSEKKREETVLKLHTSRTASTKDRLYKYTVWS